MLVGYNRKCKKPLQWIKLYEKNLGVSTDGNTSINVPDNKGDDDSMEEQKRQFLRLTLIPETY